MSNSEKRYLSGLNDKQREAAVYTEGPLLILAGAGSGKTSTMTRRVAYMIDECGISPYSILAVTFTNKAAREMRERVESLVGENTHMWILTFHSACLRILRTHAEDAGYGRDFVIYDPADQRKVVKDIVKREGLDDKIYTPQYVLSVIGSSKEKAIDSDKFTEAAFSGSSRKERDLARIYRQYETELKKNNAMDFDDMIWRTVALFEENSEILEKYRAKFRYIMVDEYQDTNYLQYRLVYLLAAEHRNICVVGDDDQCIYQWRGADIRNILSFEKDFPGAKVVKLEQNYRSTANIINAAHSVIVNNSGRKDKKLWTDHPAGSGVTYKRLNNERGEAYFVAREIDRLKEKYGSYSDFAVLYRTNAQSRVFEEAFMERGVPYKVVGSLKFYDRKEIKDIIAYMRLVANPSDNVSLLRVLNEPKRGIGERTIQKLQIIAEQNDVSILKLLTDESIVGEMSAKAASGARRFASLIMECRNGQNEMSVSEIYDKLLTGSGYQSMLESSAKAEDEERLGNLLEFKSAIITREESGEQFTLSEYLEDLTLAADIDGLTEEETGVLLMTMHSSKGLEFPVVFMAGMEDGLFPSWRSLDDENGLEEERRLCYVGMTRAKEKLYLTGVEERTIYGRTSYEKASSFLDEIDRSLMDAESDIPGKSSVYSDEFGGDVDFGYAEVTPQVKYSKKNKPFDGLKQIKEASRPEKRRQKSAMPELAPGDTVEHKKFGRGKVLSVDERSVKVVFDSAGVKKLAPDIAPIKKIQ